MKLIKRINRSRWICTLTGLLILLAGCKNVNEKDLQSEIDKLTSALVPDQRMNICRAVINSRPDGTFILSGETTDPGAKTEIIKALNNHGIILKDSLVLLPDTINNKKYMGRVSLSVINLRKKPDHAAELVSQAIMGTPVLILKNEDSWLLVQTPDKYIAWTTESSVTPLTASDIKIWKKSDRIIYLQNTGWIYQSPSSESQVIGDLVGGSLLEKTGETGKFIAVSTPDGRNGFVEKQNVMNFTDWKSNVLCSEENICNTAMTFMGLPYLWGGSSSKGVDCSGLVQSVFFRNGFILQRDASLQALHGLPVSISEDCANLRNGDLLFFGTGENLKAHVTHVGIYIGNKQYINSSGLVQINSLDSTQSNYRHYRLNQLLSARRIIGASDDAGITAVSRHPWF
jgi:gamma-D-glutamyl-L-lysine dipeptidyl-peptidase